MWLAVAPREMENRKREMANWKPANRRNHVLNLPFRIFHFLFPVFRFLPPLSRSLVPHWAVMRPPVLQLVQRVHERQRTGLDDVRMRALAGGGNAIQRDQTGDLPERIRTTGDCFD